jgi:adenine C2-methylase RlmN of 23S rRNA A2503 and tRNA A37
VTTTGLKILRSTQDQSVNLYDPAKGIETRVVHRDPNKTIIYVSSQTGCAQGCKMCWLTHNSRSVPVRNLTVAEILSQVEKALALMTAHGPKAMIHVDLMARGEPLANPHILSNGQDLIDGLHKILDPRPWRLCISSILPRKPLIRDFQCGPAWLLKPEVRLYWSWYSEDPGFRAEWLPASPRYTDVLWDFMTRLAEAREDRVLCLHWALIEHQDPSLSNSNPENLRDLQDRLSELPPGIKAKINLVHLNPPAGCSTWKEADPATLNSWIQTLSAHANVSKTTLKERVGFDVFASCGMFAS